MFYCLPLRKKRSKLQFNVLSPVGFQISFQAWKVDFYNVKGTYFSALLEMKPKSYNFPGVFFLGPD